MRRTARENAFKLIFEKSVSGGTGKITCAVLTRMMTPEENEFFSFLVDGVENNKKFLTEVIARYSHGFDTDRIYKIDLSILYVALYEILFAEDVPDKVAVNEAVELAKIYSTDNSPAFINGILATAIKDKAALTAEYEQLKRAENQPEISLDESGGEIVSAGSRSENEEDAADAR